mmetsp:Transcript_51807/g.116794  ORF Transcript_51807/g.116794 Transcript_51807/m.116794 type:complete len:201 (-) Transcript_51807:314-916(-)
MLAATKSCAVLFTSVMAFSLADAVVFFACATLRESSRSSPAGLWATYSERTSVATSSNELYGLILPLPVPLPGPQPSLAAQPLPGSQPSLAAQPRNSSSSMVPSPHVPKGHIAEMLPLGFCISFNTAGIFTHCEGDGIPRFSRNSWYKIKACHLEQASMYACFIFSMRFLARSQQSSTSFVIPPSALTNFSCWMTMSSGS